MAKASRLERQNAGVAPAAPAQDLPSAAAAPVAPVVHASPAPEAKQNTGAASAPRAPRSGQRGEMKNYYDPQVHDKVIEKFLQNEKVLIDGFKEFGYDVEKYVINPFKAKGDFDSYMRFKNLLFGTYFQFNNFFVTLSNRKDPQTGKIYRTITETNLVQYVQAKKDIETKQVIDAGHYVPAPIAAIHKRLVDYKIPKDRWNEFLQNGFVSGTVTPRRFLSQKGEELKQKGEFLDAIVADLRYYKGVNIVCAAPNGLPIIIDAGRALDRQLDRMEKFNEKEYIVKEGGFTYQVTEKELRNLYSNNTVILIGQNDKGETSRAEIHYDGAKDRICALKRLTGRDALKRAGYSYDAEKDVMIDPNKEQNAQKEASKQEAQASQDPGIGRGE